MTRRTIAFFVCASLILSACGSSTTDRAASGAGIGAAAGVVIGAVTGLSVLEGVLIGDKTTVAIEDYQRDQGLLVDGQASLDLASHIDNQLQLAEGE